jgi:hypothetical protein
MPGAAWHDDYKPQVTQQEDSERNPERTGVDATEQDMKKAKFPVEASIKDVQPEKRSDGRRAPHGSRG